MGLDALDLTYRLEQRFGITIQRQEAMAVLFDTAGTIHRYLVGKLHGDYHQTPHIEPLFIEVSKAVNRIRGRWKLTSSLDLSKLFSPTKRSSQWKALEQALEVSLPPLEHSEHEPHPSIPRQCHSILSLTYWIADHRPERVEWFPVSCERKGETATHEWSEEEIWTVLRECICNVLYVKPQDVVYDARMVEDLGMI
jgi:hypothetical protein